MSPFEEKFAMARKMGMKVFTFNGKEFNTDLKKEGTPSAKKSDSVASSTRPMARPKAGAPAPKPRARPKAGASAPPRADSAAYSGPTRAKADATAGRRAAKSSNREARYASRKARNAPKGETEAERTARLNARMRNAKGKF